VDGWGKRPLAARSDATMRSSRVTERIPAGEGEITPIIAFLEIPGTAAPGARNLLRTAHSWTGMESLGNVIKDAERAVRKVRRRPGFWEKWRLDGGRSVYGRVPYGQLVRHLPTDTAYMTLLREPIARVLAGSPSAEILGERLPRHSNLAVRLLCGRETIDELPDDALDAAKANLRKFAFVGIQERLADSIVLLQRMLGLDLEQTARLVSLDPAGPPDVSADVKMLAEEINQLDIELYRFARGLFEEAAAGSSPGVAGDATRLREISKAMRAEVKRLTLPQRDLVEMETLRRDDSLGHARISFDEKVRELTTHHGLGDREFRLLNRMVELVDWTKGNFVAEVDANGRPDPDDPAGTAWLTTALTMLVESLAGLEFVPVRAARRIADIGSGGGFPGVVLAIARPSAEVVLIERVAEKCTFLRSLAAELGLENVEVAQGSAERWSGACPDLVTSRKAARLTMSVEWASSLLCEGGHAAMWPGMTDFNREDRDSAPEAARSVDVQLEQVLPIRYRLRIRKVREKHLYLFRKMTSVGAPTGSRS
jgi:16S rRNA (guanine527-N7)-methyltransferase